MLNLRRCFRLSSTINYEFAIAKPKKEKTFYQILEVPTSATPTIIKKNYLKLAKIYHPDVYKGADRNRFQKIQEAYKVLSNQGDRSKYDETIGLRSNYQSDFSQNRKAADGANSETYGKPANDFTYSKPKVEINIDEQYEKFFKKKSQTNFEEIRLHEQTEFKNMSEKERIRRRFTEVYTDANLDWKMKYSKSYGQVLDDQISQKNQYEEQLKKRKAENEHKFTQEVINKKKIMIQVGAVLALIVLLPFIISFKTKLQLQREAKECYQKKVRDLFEEMQTAEAKNRLRFD